MTSFCCESGSFLKWSIKASMNRDSDRRISFENFSMNLMRSKEMWKPFNFDVDIKLILS